MKKIITLLFLLLLIPAAFSQPAIRSYVTDSAGVLSPQTVSRLESQLRQLEKDTNGVQFIVYIENEYPKDFSLEEYTLAIAETSGIGKKDNDNGVLLYVAVRDKQYRWEVGYGAESTLNTPLLGRISREYLVPSFQKSDYETGILSAVDVVSRILLNSNDSDIVALQQPQRQVPNKAKITFLIFAFIIFLNILSFAARNSKKFKKNNKWPDYYYTGAAGGMFAGGFGRRPPGGFGGLGGFSGGGGGFGGGGFSSRW